MKYPVHFIFDTTEWVSQGPFSLCLSGSCDSRSFSLLLCCSRRLSSASCWLHRSCRWVHWREGTDDRGGGDKGKKVFRQQNPLTVTYLDPFAPQHVLQPGHVLVHLFQLLLQDRALVWQALIYIIHLIFPPTLSGSPCSLCSSLSAHQEALWESSSRGLGSLSRRESESGKRNREKGGKRQVVSSV